MTRFEESSSGRPVRGIIPPLVTPLLERDQLDVAGLERLVEHVIGHGVHGVFILGTTGEAPSLSYRLREEVIRRTCDLVAQRVPVLVGITDTAFVESIRIAQIAGAAGAAAAVLTTPYYFPAGQTELTTYVEHLVDELDLPLMLYNMPRLTKVWYEPETLRRLADIDQIVGIKESSGDMDYFCKLISLRRDRPDWSVMMGPESLLLDALQAGADGGVCGGANLFPQWFVSCYEASRAGDEVRLQASFQKIRALQDIYTIGKYASRHIKAIKCALSLLGICHDQLAEPFNHFLPPERGRVREILVSLIPEEDLAHEIV
jgi:4-hydroxy-tetrahydrodipicolinate synthase